jgi:hypothetical protein
MVLSLAVKLIANPRGALSIIGRLDEKDQTTHFSCATFFVLLFSGENGPHPSFRRDPYFQPGELLAPNIAS